MLLVITVLMIIGCTEEVVQKEDILYPGAPIVSIKQTDFTPGNGYLKYRLEVQEPPPYNIMVKLEITQDLMKGAKVPNDNRFLEPRFPIIRMQMG